MKADWPFTSHMVLQRNQKILITGTSDGNTVTLSFGNDHFEGRVNNGHWHVELPPHKAGGPYSIIIQDETERTVLEDVWFGDVFLAAGQSNMEMKIHTAQHGPFDVKNNVRFLHMPQYIFERNGTYYPEEDLKPWKILRGDNFEELSAVAYYFARDLDIHVPIGIIDNNRGGTSASCWIDQNVLKEDADLYHTYYETYYQNIHESEEEQYQKASAYYKKLYDYVDMFDACRIAHPELTQAEMKARVGHTPWPPPQGIFDFRRPCSLYYTMFLKTACLPVKAVLWYQGEEDSLRPAKYERLLDLMIHNWRQVYQRNVPFFIIQLPEYESNEYQFAKIRFQQNEECKKQDNHLVMTLDCGEADNIHPTDKSVVGKRLADAVMHDLYAMDRPVVAKQLSMEIQDGKLVFTYDQKLQAMEAEIEFSGKNGTVVSPAHTDGRKIATEPGKDVLAQAEVVRYGNAGVIHSILRGENGIPLSPFERKLHS